MVAAERRVDRAGSRGRAALDEREVLPGHEPLGDHRAQGPVRLRRPCDHEQARGVAIEPVDDPRDLSPRERLEYYKAERERLRLAEEEGELVPAAEVEDQIAGLVKLLVQTLDTLPDLLERDVAISPDAIARAQEIVDALRQDMYDKVSESHNK